MIKVPLVPHQVGYCAGPTLKREGEYDALFVFRSAH